MSDKITEVPNIERDKMLAGLEHFRRNAAAIIEFNAELAKVRVGILKAHIEAGFTPEQALQFALKYPN